MAPTATVVASAGARAYAQRMASERPASRPPFDEGAERAARVKAMLARWRAEDAGDEPEWNIEDISPLKLEQKPTFDSNE